MFFGVFFYMIDFYDYFEIIIKCVFLFKCIVLIMIMYGFFLIFVIYMLLGEVVFWKSCVFY